MKRLGYGFIALICGRYAMVNWVAPVCLGATQATCSAANIQMRTPLLALALVCGPLFLMSALLPAGEVREVVTEVADWVLAALVTIGSLAAALIVGRLFGAAGFLLPLAVLILSPFLIRKGLRTLGRSPSWRS
jgi:hypothetical protein